MATPSAPLVSLQAPKDVSLGEIEKELSKIWQSYSIASDDGALPVATRAATFTLVIYEPEETQQLLASLGFYTGPVDGIGGPRTEATIRSAQEAYKLPVTGKATPEALARLREEYIKRRSQVPKESANGSPTPQYALDARGAGVADAIAAQNPCRIIALCATSGEDEGVTAQVSAYCPVQKQSRSALVCCEYITLKGTEAALERISSMVSSLLIPELPKFFWWKAAPANNLAIFNKLAGSVNCLIFDSSTFTEPEADLVKLQSLHQQDINVADLNWRRLAAWQELTAEAFDPPERRAALKEVDRVTIDYEKGNPAQAFMYLGWLASRLQWSPLRYWQEEGDYAIKRVQFTAADGRLIEAELAGIPTADVGEVPGDLVGLRLTSTNLDADCCTVLCSETMGCMRMEAGGVAQTCSVQQVTTLADQKAENLLSQQLQSWGRDLLYAESLALTAQILTLNFNEE